MKKLINKHKGTGSYYDDGTYEFTPQGVGEPKYKTSHKLGNGSYMAETAGTDKKSYVAHLKVDGDAPDPAQSMREQMEALIKKACPNASTPPPKLTGRVLMKFNGAIAVVQPNKGKMRLSVDFDLADGIDYANRLLQVVTEFNKALYINHEYLTNVIKQIKKQKTTKS